MRCVPLIHEQWFQAGFIGSLKGVSEELGIPLIPTVLFSPLLAAALYRYTSLPVIWRATDSRSYSWWAPAEKGGFMEKWNRETEKLQAQGEEKYGAFEKVSSIRSEHTALIRKIRLGSILTKR